MDKLDLAGFTLGDDEARALHVALDPLLVVLAYAGYRPPAVLLAAQSEPHLLVNLDLGPRGLGLREAPPLEDMFTLATGLPLPPTELVVAVPLEPRPGLASTAVPLAGPLGDAVQQAAGFAEHIVFELALVATPAALAGVVSNEAGRLLAQIVDAIAQQWSAEGIAATGLLSAIDPEYWVDGSDPAGTESFRSLAEPIAKDVFASMATLSNFLTLEAAVRGPGLTGPPSVRDRLVSSPHLFHSDVISHERAASLLSADWNDAADARILLPAVAPFRRRDHKRLSYTELVLDTYNQGCLQHTLFDFFGEDAYGGRDLALGDSGPEVKELRDDLAVLGFGPLAGVDAQYKHYGGAAWETTYGRWLETAVREFQVYASMPKLARRATDDDVLPQSDDPNRPYRHTYGSTLQPVDNDQLYDGPKSGVLNAQSRHLVKHWRDRGWVCPVVVEARTISAADLRKIRVGRPANDPYTLVLRSRPVDTSANPDLVSASNAEGAGGSRLNLWDPRQYREAEAFVAWDVTDTRPESPTTTHGDPVVLSTYSANEWGGPYGDTLYRHAQAEILPVVPLENMTREQLSTFRIVRAIAEVEAVGYYDGLNAYDTAIVSGGPLHWTLGLNRNQRGNRAAPFNDSVLYRGELVAFLAYYKDAEPAAYEASFGRFGLHAAEEWSNLPRPFFLPGHAKYAGAVGFEMEDGTIADLRLHKHTDNRDDYAPTGYPPTGWEDCQLGETLHHWHWIYRWLLADRTDTVMHRCMWDMCRARIRALLAYPWPAGGYTIGDVFTSERAVAVLERWHVFSPPELMGIDDRAAEWGTADGQLIELDAIELAVIADAYAAARAVNGEADPARWGDAEEEAVLSELETAGFVQGKADFSKIMQWPSFDKRASNNFDDSKLVALHEPDLGIEAFLQVGAGQDPVVEIIVSSTATETAGAAEDPAHLEAEVTVAGLADGEFDVVVGDPGLWYVVLTPPDGFDGDVTINVAASSRRLKATRVYTVGIDATGTTLASASGAPVRVPNEDHWPRGLSRRRGSFVFDGTGLFTQPPWGP